MAAYDRKQWKGRHTKKLCPLMALSLRIRRAQAPASAAVANATPVLSIASKTSAERISVRTYLEGNVVSLVRYLRSVFRSKTDIPGTDNIDSTSIEVRCASQAMHDPARGELRGGIDWAARDVEEGGAGADEDEAGVFGLRVRSSCGSGAVGKVTILLDEVVHGQFGRVECAL